MPRTTRDNRSILPIVYVIEASDNMAGDRIAAINEAMRECQSIFSEKTAEHPDEKIKIAVVKYGDTAEAVTKGFESLYEFEWEDVSAGGKSNFGNAIELLNKDILQKRKILKDESTNAYFRPIIFFLTSSPSSDEYLSKLADADKNVNYHYARKVCVAIGDNCDREMLVKITGTMEAVISASDLDTLKLMLVSSEMPEPDEIEEFLNKNTNSDLSDDFEKIVRVDEVVGSDSFALEDIFGSTISIEGFKHIVRCQCGPCEPKKANDIMFRLDKANDYLNLTNIVGLDDLFVSFLIEAKSERTIVGCDHTVFSINMVCNEKTDLAIAIKAKEDGLTISNLTSDAIYLKSKVDSGASVHLNHNDRIMISKNMLFTVKCNQTENSLDEFNDVDGWIGTDEW